MLTEHVPNVFGCCAKESFDGWPTVTFDLVRIHEGMNRNYEVILDYEITGNDFSKSHTIQLVMGWIPKKQAFVTHCCIINGYQSSFINKSQNCELDTIMSCVHKR